MKNNNLVGHWTFDGNRTNWATGQVTDSSGNSNTGQIVNMSTSTSPVAGNIGQGFRFDGVNDYINAGSGATLDNIPGQGGGGMTISLWVKPTSLSTLITKGGNNATFWRLTAQSGNKLQFEKDGPVDMLVRTGSDTYIDNKWNHFVVFWDGSGTASNVLFYMNGVLQAHEQDTNGFNFTADSTTEVTIGAYSDSSQASAASFDDVRIYNRQLSLSEIKQLYGLGRVK